jgi:predicted ATPase
VAEPGSVGLAVATTLSIQPQGGMTVVEAIADWLRGQRLLLILDNCEHVLSAAAALASAIVARGPTLAVLATSREPLGVAGERVVPMTGLGITGAVALFCDRVAAVDDTVRLSATITALSCRSVSDWRPPLGDRTRRGLGASADGD